MNEIKLIQSPKIDFSALEEIGKSVNESIAFTKKGDLIVTEENKKEIKTLRTKLKKEFDTYEEKRKVIKEAINVPYKEFEDSYKDNISAPYKQADAYLKKSIDEIEDYQKNKIDSKAREYFDELAKENNVDYIGYEELNFKITLSTKLLTLQEEIDSLFKRIESDLSIIETQEHKARITVKYKQCIMLDNALSYAIEEVLQEIAQENAIKQKSVQEEVPVIQKAKPAEEIKQVENHSMTFTVFGTIEQLKSVKNFLIGGGIKYE